MGGGGGGGCPGGALFGGGGGLAVGGRTGALGRTFYKKRHDYFTRYTYY